ncbi:class I SAM-dependent methyltransferase [Flavihumibacter petaseus]|uniref:Putative methyltransferase n=1 Tax=Flavihumibacter petaseus NBRC 106054 TaxID=1220578 RepID=A0A0E9MU89_9BACT|nr:hypothetical protein [Flavihumibacter petaseus]GAO41337.1 putative methyltransferase [Flavihumibacter petaseus NBRC 106054]
MSVYPLLLHEFQLYQQTVGIYVPDPEVVRRGSTNPFPYWTKIWPAALALSAFLQRQPEWIAKKNVLELGAGLGLPGFTAAFRAASVVISDNNSSCIPVLEQTARHNDFSNVSIEMLDWNSLPDPISAECILLSDINYDPEQFPELLLLFQQFIRQGKTILLSTPQRLVAKSFLTPLLSSCRYHEPGGLYDGMETSIFIF